MKEEKTKKEFVPSWGAILICAPITLVGLWYCYRVMDDALMSVLPQHCNTFVALLIYLVCLLLLIGAAMWFFYITSKRYTEIEARRKKKQTEE